MLKFYRTIIHIHIICRICDEFNEKYGIAFMQMQ